VTEDRLEPITELRYNALAGYARSPWTWIASVEFEWYSSGDEKVLGVVVQDTTDKDFVCIVMGRDRIGRYRAVHLSEWFETVGKARSHMSEILPQWAQKEASEFEQGDEPKTAVDFFTPVHFAERRNPDFNRITSQLGFSPAKGIMEAMMFYFRDPDGNFVEQFQSTAFNARLWELYLFAVLGESRYIIDRDYPVPDYLCRGLGHAFFIEAVTANPTIVDGINVEPERPLASPAFEGYMQDYLPTKFSGPLVKKLERRYWEQDHISGKPIVLAIADYHLPDAMQWSQTALITYLYGLILNTSRDEEGHFVITPKPVAEHVWGTKVIASGFFGLPDAENISAVISTREADIWKFNRMGLKAGFGASGIRMVRVGNRYVQDPDRAQPERFSVEVHDATYEENWIDGLEIYHNPRAVSPLDPEAFDGATHHFLRDGQIVSLTRNGTMFGTTTFFSPYPRFL
jgi:hypothetical protein